MIEPLRVAIDDQTLHLGFTEVDVPAPTIVDTVDIDGQPHHLVIPAEGTLTVRLHQ